MRVRALESFFDESGRHSPGDVFQMADDVAVVRIKSGLVARVSDEAETAVRSKPEMAVMRGGKR
jgi:hypothetical protein